MREVTSPSPLFLNYIFQVGKDFDAVAKLMEKRKIKKDQTQVRNYFHNTYKQTFRAAGFTEKGLSHFFFLLYDFYSKVWPAFIDLPNSFPREAKELFVLVNLGEWRKKFASLNVNRKAPKFRELVLKGYSC